MDPLDYQLDDDESVEDQFNDERSVDEDSEADYPSLAYEIGAILDGNVDAKTIPTVEDRPTGAYYPFDPSLAKDTVFPLFCYKEVLIRELWANGHFVFHPTPEISLPYFTPQGKTNKNYAT